MEIGALKNRGLIWMAEIAERTFYRGASHVVAISHRMGERLKARLGPRGWKVRGIPLGTDYARFAEAEPDATWRREQGLEDKFVAVFAGTIGRVNAVPWIVKAAALLKDEPRIRLVLIGDGEMKTEVVEQARQQGLDNVLFLDRVPRGRLTGILKTCDLGLMTLDNLPIFDTACPNKFMDYLASGLPVLVNFNGEAGWICRDEGCGVMVPPENAEAMAQAIRDLAADPDRVRRMGERGRQLAAERFDRRVLVREFEAVLDEARRADKHANLQKAPRRRVAPMGWVTWGRTSGKRWHALLATPCPASRSPACGLRSHT